MKKKDAFLISVSSDLEASMIIPVLIDNEIPAYKKFKGSGSYTNIYMGMSKMGIDIYVPEEQLAKAKEIVRSMSYQKESSFSDNELDEIEKDFARKRRIRVWIAILLFMPGIIWFVIMFIVKLLNII